MNLEPEQRTSHTDIIKQVEELKSLLTAMYPLPQDVEQKVMQKLRFDWNYHSNAIEGNDLSYGEMVALLQNGITAKGKLLKDHLDISGHNDAISLLLSITNDNRPLTEMDIRSLCTMILVEPYLQEPKQFEKLSQIYTEALTKKDAHPLEAAALFHQKFIAEYGTDNTSGRLGRLLVNCILMQAQYPPVVIKLYDRKNYDKLLNSNAADHLPYLEYLAIGLSHSLEIYIKAAKGEDIDEDEDLDKEIAVFRAQIKDQVKAKTRKNYAWTKDFLSTDLTNLLTRLNHTVKPFGDDFAGTNIYAEFVFLIDGITYPHTKIFDEETLERLQAHFNALKGLHLNLVFKRFKDTDHPFDVGSIGYIYFEDFKYDIYGNKHTLILSKYYPEKLTSDDHKKIIRSFVEDIKVQIQQGLK